MPSVSVAFKLWQKAKGRTDQIEAEHEALKKRREDIWDAYRSATNTLSSLIERGALYRVEGDTYIVERLGDIELVEARDLPEDE